MCTATRLSQATIIPNKTTLSLIHALEMSWIRPYGPMDTLISDQESGLNSDEARVFLSRTGIVLELVGVDDHAKMIEKHNHILRLTYLKLRSQAIEQGLNVPNEHLLTCCVTAKNSTFAVGDTTPMMAAIGKQPAVLPNLDTIGAQADDSHTGPDGYSRGRLRLKELSLQNIAEVSALQRMQIAARTKTRPSVQATGLQAGDEV